MVAAITSWTACPYSITQDPKHSCCCLTHCNYLNPGSFFAVIIIESQEAAKTTIEQSSTITV